MTYLFLQEVLPWHLQVAVIQLVSPAAGTTLTAVPSLAMAAGLVCSRARNITNSGRRANHLFLALIV